jgi:L,D-transpeptidase catalytic domain/Putative peptidoglycan binding domain
MRGRVLALLALCSAVPLLLPNTAAAGPRSVLSYGMCGGDVFGLQVRLARRSYLPKGYHPGCFDYRTQQAVIAFQGWVNFPRTGVADALTQRRLVLSVTPKPWSIAYRHIEVHKNKQIMILVTRDRTVYRTIHVSTAAPGHVTPSGRFHIYAKSRMSWSTLFHVWLPWANYVVGGIAIHGFASVPPYPASHGCIRVPMPEAPMVYWWAPLGTPVSIWN